MKMKNRKGFTLIELLAVITILGILMIVAIPAVSRTIENSRRNTFLSTAKEYANSVKTKYAADEIKCGADRSSATILAKNNAFVIRISTKDGTTTETATSTNGMQKVAYNNAKELINQGGVSSWGNADLYGFVVGWVTEEKGNDNNMRQVVKYYINLVDAATHGIAWSGTETDKLERMDVLPADAKLLNADLASGQTLDQKIDLKATLPNTSVLGTGITAIECRIQ